MNKKSSINSNKLKFYILSFIIIGLCIFIFEFKPDTIKASAATEDAIVADENVSTTNNTTVASYTVDFYNGSNVIGSFNISSGDQYVLTRTGYSINGVSFDFSGKNKMSNCAYGDYYGSPIIDDVVVATYGGWALNKTELLANSGVWKAYSTSILKVYAVWVPEYFTVELNDAYTGTSSSEVNYFDGITLPDRYREGYEFKGWETDDGFIYQSGTQLNPLADIELTAMWEELFTVRLISNEHRSYNRTWEGSIGDTFTLPSLTSGYFYVSQWGTYQVGSEYTIMGNVTLYAVWKGNTYTVTYENLIFMGRTASIICDDYMIGGTSTTYEYGVGFDLTRVKALWIRNNNYDIYLKFLGWYTNKEFTTKVPGISPTETGNKTYYAKWRYDYNRNILYRKYTITDVDPYTKDCYDSIYIGLKSNNLYQELKDLSVKYIYLEFKLQIREIDDGYQEVLIYKDTSPTSNPIWSLTNIEHDPSGTNTTPAYYRWTCAFKIDDLKDCNGLYVRYGAHGFGADTWVTERLYVDIMYTATESSDEDIEKFTWDYSAEVKDEDCISLNT